MKDGVPDRSEKRRYPAKNAQANALEKHFRVFAALYLFRRILLVLLGGPI